jgi:hypothetical protein
MVRGYNLYWSFKRRNNGGCLQHKQYLEINEEPNAGETHTWRPPVPILLALAVLAGSFRDREMNASPTCGSFQISQNYGVPQILSS